MATEPDFTLRMYGTGKDGQPIRPGSVDVGDLANFLANWEKAVISTAEANQITLPKRDDKPILSLVNIKEGSCGLDFRVVDKAILVMGIISAALANHQLGNLTPKTIDALADISEQADHRNWSVEIIPGPSNIIQRAEISRANPIQSEEVQKIEGTTTLIGELLRVGGAVPRAEVRDNSGDIHYIKINAEQAKRLAPRLYKDVVLDGDATWDAVTWKILDFKVTEILDYELPDTLAAFEELARRVNGAWDGVDVETYFNMERNENI